MKNAPKFDPKTINNGVGNWVLFFVGLEKEKMNASELEEFLRGGGRGNEDRGVIFGSQVERGRGRGL